MKISPHVFIYRFPIGAISSITNRVTGLYLTGIFLGTGIYQYCPIDYEEKLKKIGKPYQSILIYSILFSSCYHTLGGIRHFIWDKKPSLITTKITTKSSYLLFGTSIGLSYFLEKMINHKSKYLKKKE